MVVVAAAVLFCGLWRTALEAVSDQLHENPLLAWSERMAVFLIALRGKCAGWSVWGWGGRVCACVSAQCQDSLRPRSVNRFLAGSAPERTGRGVKH